MFYDMIQLKSLVSKAKKYHHKNYAGVGVQWSTLNRGPNENETFSMANVFVFQLIDIVLYGFLTWYVDTIKPGEFGTAEPWYFLVSVSNTFNS